MKKIIFPVLLSFIIIMTSAFNVTVADNEAPDFPGSVKKTEAGHLTVRVKPQKTGKFITCKLKACGAGFKSGLNYYNITKTSSNYKITAKERINYHESGMSARSGNSPVYVKYNLADEIIIGDFSGGFITAISTRWEDIVYIYDLEEKASYRIIAPLNVTAARKTGAGTFEISCGTYPKEIYTAEINTAYAYDLYLNGDDITVIPDNSPDLEHKEALQMLETVIVERIAKSEQGNSLRQDTPAPETLYRITAAAGIYEALKMLKAEENEKIENASKSVSTSVFTDYSSENMNNGKLIEVPALCQLPHYPTGCEAFSAVMLLNYAGYNIPPDDFINVYLDTSSDFYFENDLRYGPSPYEYFVGYPGNESSFGCMAPVIIKAMKDIVGKDKRVINLTGNSLEKLSRDYIDNGMPVIIWATMDMSEPYESDAWYLDNGHLYIWLSGEHCLLLVGYSEDEYYFNDPYTGQCVKYDKYSTEYAFERIGSQAVSIQQRK